MHDRRWIRRTTALAVLLGLTACSTPPADEDAAPVSTDVSPPLESPRGDNALAVDPASRDFSSNPKLLDRIRATPHGYFRFINVPFSREVCRRFSDLTTTASLNLHGDAHIEQYAVTDLGRGLTDFDDSSTGPAIIDLARFGVSLVLASRQQGLEDAEPEAFAEFLRGYREALDGSEGEPPVPDLVARKEAEFRYDRDAYFRFVESIMEPVPEDETAEVFAALGDYFAAMRADYPEHGDAYFDVVDLGYLRQGIGSALDLKYLVRTRGPSDDPRDDVVLEVKQVRDLTSIDCIRVAGSGDPFRVLKGQARIANAPFRYLGYARFRAMTFWVHAWVENYSEIKIGDDLTSAEDLRQVAYDAGVQLGRGHVRMIAAPVEQQLRSEQSRLVAENAERIEAECRLLADLAVEAWETFKAASPPQL